MARTDAEPKPQWPSLPPALRQKVATQLGAPVIRARVAWGGYAPTPTFHLMLSNGSRYFFKGTNSESNDFMRAALDVEARAYSDLRSLASDFMPAFYGAIRHDDWHVLLLEDVGQKGVLPWQPPTLQAVIAGMADFHRATVGENFPQWLPRIEDEAPRMTDWTRIWTETDGLNRIARLAGDKRKRARAWLDRAAPLLAHRSTHMAAASPVRVLLHGDLRSDNLRLVGRQLKLFDWPAAMVGYPEWEVVMFAQSVDVEKGATPEQVIGWYAEHTLLREAAISAAIVWGAAFFMGRFWQPPIPGLPRLRPFQLQQFTTLAHWMARRFDFDPPDWIDAINI